VAVTDENGRTTVSSFQSFGDPDDGRLASVRDANGVTTYYSYDSHNLLNKVDPPGSAGDRAFTYHATHLLASESQGESGLTEYRYDSGGRKTRRAGSGQSTYYSYDDINRLVSIDSPGTVGDVSFSYDKAGNRIWSSTALVDTTYDFDDLSRMTRISMQVAARNFETRFFYDNVDNLTRVRYPSGREVDYGYNSGRQVIGVPGYVSSLSYHPAGVAGGSVLDLLYDYNPTGDITSIQDRRSSATKTVEYDELARLSKADGSWGEITYAYDSLGNRTRKMVNGVPTTYSYDSNNRLVRLTVTDGNSTSYTYDPRGRLTSRVSTAVGSTPTGTPTPTRTPTMIGTKPPAPTVTPTPTKPKLPYPTPTRTPTPTPPTQGSIIGEVGTVTVDNTPLWVPFSQKYVEPVVFAQPPSVNERDATVARITDVTSDGFMIYLHEPPNLDASHELESVSWLVLEGGSWRLTDGTLLEVGTRGTSATVGPRVTNAWEWIDFDTSFGQLPVVITQTQTSNDPYWVKTRLTGVSNFGMNVALEQDEAAVGTHGYESVGWLAVEPGSGIWSGLRYQAANTPDLVTHDWHTIGFSQSFGSSVRLIASLASYDGSNPSSLRHQGLGSNGVQVMVEEDTAVDAEIAHTTEVVSYLAIEGPGTVSGERVTASIARLLVDGPEPVAQTISAEGTASFSVSTTGGTAPLVYRWQYSPDEVGGFWDLPVSGGYSGVGTSELTVSPASPHDSGWYRCIVSDSSSPAQTMTSATARLVVTLDDFVIGETGRVDVTHVPRWVTFARTYADPVVFALPPSFMGAHAAVVRITEVSSDGFELYIHEAPNGDGSHLTETVNWLVLEAGRWQLENGAQLEAGSRGTAATVGPNVADRWQWIGFSSSFGQVPVVISQVQTNDDPHWVKTRQLDATTTGFRVALEEEEIASGAHMYERVGWLAMQPSSGRWSGHHYQAGSTPAAVTHNWYTVEFALSVGADPRFVAGLASYRGSNPSELRYRSLSGTGVQVKVEEDATLDAEIKHIGEVVGFLAIGGSGTLTGRESY
jgi:YD repeat-containing protein